MTRKLMILALAVILLVGVASTFSGISYGSTGAETLFGKSMGFFAMPEPTRLVVIGVCLIGLSLLVRRGISGKRG